uniref:Peptidase M10 serralysin C-terminal domain-containing protein n=1 Tax=Rhodosorus marinus TaxID=101924 RepID=A0A7S2ZRA8_9RHOD
MINEYDKLPGLNFSAFRGTESNDLFILNENEEVLNYAVPYGGYDVVIGTEGKDALAGGFTSEGGITAFLKGGNDTFESGSGQAKIYLGKGDDHVRSIIGPDGYQDFFYGGEGLDMITGIYDDTDILKSIENRPS